MRRVPALAWLALLLAGCADKTPLPEPLAPAARGDLVRVVGGNVALRVRVVSRHAERQRGLMGVESLGAGEGMLFVYREPVRRRFWMRGCRMALDIAFLDTDGRILQVDTLQPPAAPGDEAAETRRSPPSIYVLETAAGFLRANGLGVGTLVRIPPSVDPARADP